jgi:hypothetical protein
MRCSITEREGALVVRIDDIRGGEQTLLDKIRQCRASAWACPSGECMNVGSIDERVEGEAVLLTLMPRHQQTLDRAGIGECLRYMLGQPIDV